MADSVSPVDHEKRVTGLTPTCDSSHKNCLSPLSGIAPFGSGTIAGHMATRRTALTSVFLSLLLALIANAAGQSPARASHPIVLHAARLLDVKTGRILKPGEILVEGDRIAEVGTSVKHPAGAEVIDLGRSNSPSRFD